MLLQWVMTHIYTLREKGTAEMRPHVEWRHVDHALQSNLRRVPKRVFD
jgi:hypothetical protein